MTDLSKMRDALLSGDANTVVSLTNAALAEGVSPSELVNKHMVPALDEAGSKFEANEIFVPELLLIARAMKAGLQIIRPLLAQSGAEPVGRVAIGTVKGDLHDIGKNLVCMMLEGAGFEIVDLGVDVPPEKFVDAVVNQGVDIVAMSALLTTTMPNMKSTLEAIKAAGVRDKVKIMVGGAPVTDAYAKEIGADGYSADASRAVTLAKSLVGA